MKFKSVLRKAEKIFVRGLFHVTIESIVAQIIIVQFHVQVSCKMNMLSSWESHVQNDLMLFEQSQLEILKHPPIIESPIYPTCIFTSWCRRISYVYLVNFTDNCGLLMRQFDAIFTDTLNWRVSNRESQLLMFSEGSCLLQHISYNKSTIFFQQIIGQ